VRLSEDVMARLEARAKVLGMSAGEAAKVAILESLGEAAPAGGDAVEPKKPSHKELSAAERARQREIRERRQRVADEHGVAIGFVRPDGTLEPNAKKLPPEVLKMRSDYARAIREKGRG
jgi:hypothetical protein